MSGLAALIQKIRGGDASETSEPKETVDMDLTKATIEDIQNANPALYDAIVAKALTGVEESRGKRIGASEQDAGVADSKGARIGDKAVAGETEAAVAERAATVQPAPKDTSTNTGTDLNDEAAKRAAAAAAKLSALEANQTAIRKSVADLQKGLGEMATTLTAILGKIDTSRPGEAAIVRENEKAVATNAAAVDAAAKAGDSGIGAIETSDGDSEAEKARKAELATLQQQVADLGKTMPQDADRRLANIEKALAKMLRESVTIAKTAPVGRADDGRVAKSEQAGELDEVGAREARVAKTKTHFDGAISLIAMARESRGSNRVGSE